MGADDGAVNDEVFGVRVIGQVLVERGPGASVAPVGVASADGVPFAVFRREHSPRRAGAGNPEYSGNEAAAIGFRADVEVEAAAEEGEDFVPLVGCQFQVCHAAMITPKCQHGLATAGRPDALRAPEQISHRPPAPGDNPPGPGGGYAADPGTAFSLALSWRRGRLALRSSGAGESGGNSTRMQAGAGMTGDLTTRPGTGNGGRVQPAP